MANNLNNYNNMDDNMDDYEEDDDDIFGDFNNAYAYEGLDSSLTDDKFDLTDSQKTQSNKPDISIPFENINIGDIITVVAGPTYEVPTSLTGFSIKEDTIYHNNIMLVTAMELPFIGITNFSRVYTDVGYEKLVFNEYSGYKFFKLSDKFVKAAMYSTRYKDLDRLRKEAIKNAK